MFVGILLGSDHVMEMYVCLYAIVDAKERHGARKAHANAYAHDFASKGLLKQKKICLGGLHQDFHENQEFVWGDGAPHPRAYPYLCMRLGVCRNAQFRQIVWWVVLEAEWRPLVEMSHESYKEHTKSKIIFSRAKGCCFGP